MIIQGEAYRRMKQRDKEWDEYLRTFEGTEKELAIKMLQRPLGTRMKDIKHTIERMKKLKGK